MGRQRNTAPRQPLRVVFDSQARLPLDSQLLATLDQSPVLVIVAPGAPDNRVAALREAGAEIFVSVDIDGALRELGRRGITSLFLEGGRTLASSFLAADQLDESRTFIAPMLLGRAGDVSRAGQDPPRRAALSLATEQVGEDVLVTARYKEW